MIANIWSILLLIVWAVSLITIIWWVREVIKQEQEGEHHDKTR